MKTYLNLLLIFTFCILGKFQTNAEAGLFSNFGALINQAYVKEILGPLAKPVLQPDPMNCWLCTLEVNAVMQYTILHGFKIDDFIMHDLCKMFPDQIKSTCKTFIKIYGPTIITYLVTYSSPDQACRAINLCNMPQCNLFPSNKTSQVKFSQDWTRYLFVEEQSTQTTKFDGISFLLQAYQTIAQHSATHGDGLTSSSIVDWFVKLQSEADSPDAWIQKLTQDLAKNNTPSVDLDHDKFSQLTAELRGYNWRGRDCNDNDAKIYPGRKTNPASGLPIDYNCNGISGIDPVTAKSYKDLLCNNSGQLGVMVMGDSAGAHAEIPSQWMNASQWDSSTFQNIAKTLANDFDLPHMSGYTGYADTGYTGPVSSVYKYLYQRNKCNFRDYQNIAVNGVNSRNGMNTFSALARDKQNDFPLLLFLEMIGNDVCSWRQNWSHLTTPDEFRKNILNILAYLDTVLPPGSHLVTLGLANGSLIYEAVDGRTHPSGVTYNELYDFQNCLGATMCWGWLNNNQTVRDITTGMAMQLNQVYKDIFSTYKAQNYDFVYYDFPTNEIFGEYAAAGGDVFDLIEHADGFHPSQIMHAKLGDWLWNSLMRDRPEWLGDENPNNDLITKLFGNQGGY